MSRHAAMWIGFSLAVALLVWMHRVDHHALWAIYPSKPAFARDFYLGNLVEAAMFRDRAYSALWNPEENLAWRQAHGFSTMASDALYPPLFAICFIPFLGLSIPAACWAWFLINQAIAWSVGILAGLWASHGRRAGERAAIGALSGLALVFSAFAFDCLTTGQAGFLLTATTLGFAIADVSGRRRTAAILLSLAISLKVYPAVFLLGPLARRDWKFLLLTLLGCLGWTVPVLLYTGLAGPELYVQYVAKVLPALSFTVSTADQSVTGALGRLFDPYTARTTGMTVGALIVGLTYVRLALLRDRPEVRAYAVALCSLLQILSLGRSWPHYHVVLALAAAAFVVSRGRRLDQAALGFLALLWFQMAFDGEIAARSADIRFRQEVLNASWPCIVNLLLWGLMVVCPPGRASSEREEARGPEARPT